LSENGKQVAIMNEQEYLEQTARRTRRTGRRIRILLVVALVVVAFVGGSIAYMVWTAEAGLLDAIAEADRNDPGWRLQDLESNRRQMPDEENIGLVVITAQKLMPTAWPSWDHKGPEAERLRESFSDLKPQNQLSAEQIKALREETRRADAAIQEAMKALDMSWGRFPISYGSGVGIIGTLLPHTQDTRNMAYLLGAAADLKAQDGDADGALNVCRAIMKNARAVGDEPFFISMLVRVAVRAVARGKFERVLAQGEPSDAALVQMQILLEEELKDNLLLTGARGERAVGDEIMSDLQRSPGRARQLVGLTSGGPGISIMSLDGLRMLMPGAMKTNRMAMLKFNSQVVEIAKLPVDEQFKEFKNVDASAGKLPPMARLIVPALVKVANASLRDIAQTRCAIVMVAAERYRRAEGHLPASIADLVPKYLPAVPLDPFDGKPLKMRRFEEGLAIYSVGEGQVDEGGKLEEEKGKTRPANYGYRLWDVKYRRQPAAKATTRQ
jgi:hypothetical protein